MARIDKHNAAPISLRRHFCVLATVWTMVIVAMWSWNMHHKQVETSETARHHVRTAFEKDLIYRHWAANHGGVCEPIPESTPTHPHLAHTEERGISARSGRKLTLVDPAYMTRFINKMSGSNKDK